MQEKIEVGLCPRGHSFAPWRPVCGACGRSVRRRRVAARGTVVTWTHLAMPPEGASPVRVGIVALDAGPRLLARLVGAAWTTQRVRVREGANGYEAHGEENVKRMKYPTR